MQLVVRPKLFAVVVVVDIIANTMVEAIMKCCTRYKNKINNKQKNLMQLCGIVVLILVMLCVIIFSILMMMWKNELFYWEEEPVNECNNEQNRKEETIIQCNNFYHRLLSPS